MTQPHADAKNALIKLLDSLGRSSSDAEFALVRHGPPHDRKVRVSFGPDLTLEATGTGERYSDADSAAAEVVLRQIAHGHPELPVDWDRVMADAQAGDALLKLAVYTASGETTAHGRSAVLQRAEADAALARKFDALLDAGDSRVAHLGRALGEKRKASYFEALVWRRYGERVLGPSGRAALAALLEEVGVGEAGLADSEVWTVERWWTGDSG